MYMTSFGRTGLTIGPHGVVFHGEFDGDLQKCVALYKNMFSSDFIDFYGHVFDFRDFCFSTVF